jgi:hypothetical protein
VGIFKSGNRLWPRNTFSRNICHQFSILVLCSAVVRESLSARAAIVINTDFKGYSATTLFGLTSLAGGEGRGGDQVRNLQFGRVEETTGKARQRGLEYFVL